MVTELLRVQGSPAGIASSTEHQTKKLDLELTDLRRLFTKEGFRWYLNNTSNSGE